MKHEREILEKFVKEGGILLFSNVFFLHRLSIDDALLLMTDGRETLDKKIVDSFKAEEEPPVDWRNRT